MNLDYLFDIDDLIMVDDLMFLSIESIAEDTDFAQSFLQELYKDISFN
jgi:hypothetical protein